MLSQRVTVAQLIDCGIRLSWQEAVAMTQGIASLGISCPDDGPRANLLAGFALDEDGTVAAVGSDCPALSLSELALFLVQLLPPEDDEHAKGSDELRVDRRTPAALHLTIGRALDLAEAPPFASVADFCDALAGFEDDSRTRLLRIVHGRCVSKLNGGVGDPLSPWDTKVGRDRRTSGPRVDALRRMIRERDHHDYLVRSAGERRKPAQATRRSPSVDVLRRSLREVDRENYEMLARLRATRRPRFSALPIAVLGLAAMVVAGIGLVQRDASRAGSAAPPAAVQGVVEPARPPMEPDANDQEAASLPAANEVSATPDSAPDASRANTRSEKRVSPRNNGHPRADELAAASRRETSVKAPATRNRRPARVAVQSAGVKNRTTTPRKRWAPLRLFAAIGRRLGSALPGV